MTSPSTTIHLQATTHHLPSSSRQRAGAAREVAAEMTAIKTSNTITIMIMTTTTTTIPTAGMDLLTRTKRFSVDHLFHEYWHIDESLALLGHKVYNEIVTMHTRIRLLQGLPLFPACSCPDSFPFFRLLPPPFFSDIRLRALHRLLGLQPHLIRFLFPCFCLFSYSLLPFFPFSLPLLIQSRLRSDQDLGHMIRRRINKLEVHPVRSYSVQ